MPSYNAPRDATARSLSHLRDLGAQVVSTRGVSDVALARCWAAAKALHFLAGYDGIPLRYVLWHDDDIVLHSPACRGLLGWLDTLSTFSVSQGGKPVAVSARYLTQHRPAIAASHLYGSEHQKLCGLKPVYSGLGAHAMHLEAWLAFCRKLQHVVTLDGTTMVPCVTASGPLQLPDRVVWSSEDSTYCALLESAGYRTYLTPVLAGHIPREGEKPRWPEKDSPTLDERERQLRCNPPPLAADKPRYAAALAADGDLPTPGRKLLHSTGN